MKLAGGSMLLFALIFCSGALQAQEPLKAVVVTGGHGYDKEPFEEVFTVIPHGDFTFFPLQDESELFEDISDWPYEVIILYNMSQKISEKRQDNFIELLNQGVGLVVLHHAIAAFQEWPEYRKIIGTKYWLADTTTEDGVFHPISLWKHGVDMAFHIEDPDHPVVAGLEDFILNDETYLGHDVEVDNHLLLSCDTEGSQKEVAWVRNYGRARVCFIQPGHDAHAFNSPIYRKLVAQAIEWVRPEK
jgi:type 1 glutamine amidotransferase